MKFRPTIIILLLLSAVMISSCRSRGGNSQKQAYEAQDQLKKDQDEAIAEYRQHHYDIQANKTQEMMKESKKRNKKLKNRGREPFFKRIFGGNRAKGCNGN